MHYVEGARCVPQGFHASSLPQKGAMHRAINFVAELNTSEGKVSLTATFRKIEQPELSLPVRTDMPTHQELYCMPQKYQQEPHEL